VDVGWRRKSIDPKDVPMLLRSVVVVGALVCVVGCGHRADDGLSKLAATQSPTAHLSVQHGSLTADERSLATTIAKRQQRKVTGTFVGATAFATHGTPFDQASACDVDKRFVNIRLVWKADANFTHSYLPNSPPDGPRKDLLVTVDPTTGHICESGAGYRNVGAAASETLLYGQWPSRADG
jgi:hypothetical protein